MNTHIEGVRVCVVLCVVCAGVVWLLRALVEWRL